MEVRFMGHQFKEAMFCVLFRLEVTSARPKAKHASLTDQGGSKSLTIAGAVGINTSRYVTIET